MELCARLRTHRPAPRRSGIMGVVITVVTWKLAHCPPPCTATTNCFDFDNPCSHPIEMRQMLPGRCRLLFASLTEKVEVSLAGPPAPLSAADREAVAHALAQLDEPSCLLVRRRFGFDAGREWNLEEIARALGVSKERVRQMERWALDRLAVVLAEGHAAASPGGPGHQDQPI